jgi:hypothetical protein
MSTTETAPCSVSEQVEHPAEHPAERRAFPRFPILQRCFAYPPDGPAAQAWQVIAYNISATGVGIALPCPVEIGTVLELEAWQLPRAPRLQIRVLRARLFNFVWFCGCELLTPLTEEQLSTWLAGPIDWVPKKAPGLGF